MENFSSAAFPLFEDIERAIDNGTMTWELAHSLMETARMYDPTESGPAAEIRDFIRDNTELVDF